MTSWGGRTFNKDLFEEYAKEASMRHERWLPGGSKHAKTCAQPHAQA